MISKGLLKQPLSHPSRIYAVILSLKYIAYCGLATTDMVAMVMAKLGSNIDGNHRHGNHCNGNYRHGNHSDSLHRFVNYSKGNHKQSNYIDNYYCVSSRITLTGLPTCPNFFSLLFFPNFVIKSLLIFPTFFLFS